MNNYIDNFITYKGNECRLTCFQNFFKNCGLNISESHIYFLGDGFGIVYKRKNKDGEFDVFFDSNVWDSINRFCHTYKVQVDFFNGIKNHQVRDIFHNCINQANPVIVRVDADYLKYHTVFRNANGIPHFILVIGFNDKDVLISDGFVPTVPTSIFHDWYDFNLLEEGMSRRNNQCIIINKNSLDHIRSQWDLHNQIDMLLSKLKNGIRSYLNGYEENDSFFGINALLRFKEDIPFLMDYFGDAYSEKLQKLGSIVRIGGPMISRVLLEQILQSINDSGLNIFDNKIIDEIRSINAKWNTFCFLLVRAAISKRKNDLDIMVRKINEIMDYETGIFNALLDY